MRAFKKRGSDGFGIKDSGKGKNANPVKESYRRRDFPSDKTWEVVIKVDGGKNKGSKTVKLAKGGTFYLKFLLFQLCCITSTWIGMLYSY